VRWQDGGVSTDLIERAQAGDEVAFSQLIEPYRRELEVHCYRMLGSLHDAEDALQETLLAAWRGLAGFEGRSSVRTWLYRVATTRCLNARRSARSALSPGWEPPEPTRLGEVTWLEPCPDALLEGLTDSTPGPEARYEATEAISLAFITAVQLLPPRQRAALILRDVLGLHASEVADTLAITEESVTSALKRARAAVKRRLAQPADTEPPALPGSAAEKELIDRLTQAYETGDVDAIVAALTDNVWVTMPPLPLEYQGRDLAARFLAAVAFRSGRTYRLLPTRANGQLAFGAYVQPSQTGATQANGLLVLTLAGNRVSALTRFEAAVLPRFGLPLTLPS
jgi:RNA polymerase sigma-70 factor, ECF subfamily